MMKCDRRGKAIAHEQFITIESKIIRLNEVTNIKPALTTVLISLGVLLIISSYATVSTGWELLPRGETQSVGDHLKLLSMDIPLTGNPSADVEYWATIKFDAGFKPEIRRACFNFSGDRQSCVDVEAKDVTYGHFRVPIHVPADSKRIDCYAEYNRGGKTSRTNTITYYLIVLKKPKE
jgi:hypothetical protein